jgi:hypothetical protein
MLKQLIFYNYSSIVLTPFITHFGKASRGDQTYIARANYTDIHGASSLLKFINVNTL